MQTKFHLYCMIDDDIELHPMWKKNTPAIFFCICLNNRRARVCYVEMLLMRFCNDFFWNLKYLWSSWKISPLDAINSIGWMERARQTLEITVNKFLTARHFQTQMGRLLQWLPPIQTISLKKTNSFLLRFMVYNEIILLMRWVESINWIRSESILKRKKLFWFELGVYFVVEMQVRSIFSYNYIQIFTFFLYKLELRINSGSFSTFFEHLLKL